jgi:uncharacterized protein (TIGR03437 family)
MFRRSNLLGLAGSLIGILTAAAQETALDRYVAEADPAYTWRLAQTLPGPAILPFRTHVLEMTSQSWRSATEVDRPVWRHWLRIVVPPEVRSRVGFLLINGGSNTDPRPGQVDLQLAAAAVLTGAVLVELQTVPNQPLVFAGEERPRSEDALVAYSWDKYLRTGGERWPAQLPMTKAAVRAMDTATSFLKSPEGGGLTVDKFITAGGSKRGWVAWLAAAVDRRVVAAVPLVIDLLNLEPSFEHHWRTYGFWAPAVADYEGLGIMTWFGARPISELLRIVDPFSYRQRLTMPKYIVNAAGDEFFVPDSSQHYFDALPGEKYLRYVPNSSHALEEPDVLASILAFSQAVIAGTPRPRFLFDLPASGSIVVRAEDSPAEVNLWQATNPAARDFRVATIGRTWTSTPLSAGVGGSYEARVSPPAQGWTAFFVELTYPVGLLAMKFTTPVRVVPDTLPFPTPLRVLSAASGVPLTASEGILSAYGSGLATATTVASLPLPSELDGLEVWARDAAGRDSRGSVYFVSPTQVNFVLGPGLAPGLARVELRRQGSSVSTGAVLIEDVAPALLSANGDGQGVAAALAVTVKPDGSQVIRLVFDESAPPGNRMPAPINLGDGSDRVYLALFGTGMRQAPGEGRATADGVEVPVIGPVAQSEYPGLDQANLGPLPRSLAGRGEVTIQFVLRGKEANPVTVTIQ